MTVKFSGGNDCCCDCYGIPVCTNADEWQYYVESEARITVYESNGNARTKGFREGDAGYVQQSFPLYVENTCEGQ